MVARTPLCCNADVGEGKRTSAKAVKVGIEKKGWIPKILDKDILKTGVEK